MFSEAIIIPVLVAVVQIIKGLGLPKKYSAVVSLVLGIVAGILYMDHPELKVRVLQGIIYGLSAAGLYSGAKNTMEEIKYRRSSSK